MRHVALVAAAVEVFYVAVVQVPFRLDVHYGFVVASENAHVVVDTAADDTLRHGYAHRLEAGLVQLLVCLGILDGGRHQSVVVDADIGGCGHRSIVAAAIDEGCRAAAQLEVGLGKVGLGLAVVGVGRSFLVFRIIRS